MLYLDMAFGQAIRAHLCQPGGYDKKSNFTLSPTKASWPLCVVAGGLQISGSKGFFACVSLLADSRSLKRHVFVAPLEFPLTHLDQGSCLFFTEDACTLTLMALVLDEFRSVTAWFQVHLKKMLGWSMCCCTMAMCCFKGFQWAQCSFALWEKPNQWKWERLIFSHIGWTLTPANVIKEILVIHLYIIYMAIYKCYMCHPSRQPESFTI